MGQAPPDLGCTRTQVAGRLHAVVCELVPGGVSKEITAGHAAQLLGSITPSGAVEAARCELAAEFLDDLRRIDAQLRDAKKKLAAAVRAFGSTLTQIFGRTLASHRARGGRAFRLEAWLRRRRLPGGGP
jgi:transposase